jgi:Flp pilus assembly pilin Flp
MLTRTWLVLREIYRFEGVHLEREEGQTATEYAVVLGIVVVGLGTTAVVLRDQIVAYINRVGAALAALPF